MRRWRPILAAAAALLLLAGYLLIVRIPADAVGVVESGRAGEAPGTLDPGIHVRSPGSSVIVYSTRPASAQGETFVTPATGGEIPARFSVSARLDPARAANVHAAMAGRTLEDFLSAQTGVLLREVASRAEAVQILTPQFREEAAAAIADMLGRAGLLDAKVTIRPPDDATLLAASQYLAPRGEAWKIRQAAAEAMQEPEAGKSWKLLTALGLINESERLFAEAEKNYLDALAIEPTAMPPMSQLVGLYTAVREWDKLARILDAAIMANPASLQHINWMAMVLLKKEDYVSAELLLRKGLEVEPGNTTLLANLGALHMKMNKIDEALTSFRQAVEAAPDNPQALFNLGSALAATDRYAEALPYLDRAEQEGSANYPLVRTLALVHEKLGHTGQATIYQQKARQMEAEDASRKKPPRKS